MRTFFLVFSSVLIGCGPGLNNSQVADGVLEGDANLRMDEVSRITLDAGESHVYALNVQASMDFQALDRVHFTLSGGTGDADLYLKYGTFPEPWSDENHCNSNDEGNDESCWIDPPRAGTWYIMVQAYSDVVEVSLESSAPGLFRVDNFEPEVQPTPPEVPGYEPTLPYEPTETVLFDEVISGPEGVRIGYPVSIGAGETLTVSMGAGQGDPDLYVYAADSEAIVCQSLSSGTEETCTAEGPADLDVMVLGYLEFSEVEILGVVN